MAAWKGEEMKVSFGEDLGLEGEIFISSFTLNKNNNIEPIGSIANRDIVGYMPGRQEITGTIEFIMLPETEKWLNAKEGKKKISEKKVKDCSPAELLFAVREQCKKK